MTEKRYTLEEFGLNFIVNDNGRNLTAKQTVDRLNELNDENEQLKHECNYLQNRLDDFINIQNENEQLKKELEKFKEWEKHIRDVRREDLDRVFKMSIYEIEEAFEYYKERIKKLENELKK